MNNWRLLLLAVVAVLQPIGSFTESNLIDGRQECCDHRSNSITQDTRLYGNYRKAPEERRLSTREDIREERRYEARNDPITRSRERPTLNRAERRNSFEPALRFSTKTRFVRDQERRNRISDDAREFRLTREDQNRRSRDSVSGDSLSQYERDILDSRRIKMSRDDTRSGRIDNERLHRESLDSRDAQRFRNSEDLRRVSTTKETVAVLNRERNDIARDVIRRDSGVDDNRERRTLDRRARGNADDNRRSRSLDFRVISVNERDDLSSRTDSLEDRRSHFRAISERVDDRRQRDQNRESRDMTSNIYRDFQMREVRDAVERVDRTRRNIRDDHNNERIHERRQQRDESRLFRERLILRESNHGTSAERRQTLARESRVLNANVRPETVVRSNERIDERREASGDVFRAAGGRATERRQVSRASRMLQANSRDDRLVRGDERKDERRQPSTRSLDRVTAMRFSRESRSMERENNFRNSARFPERSVRDERAARYRRDVRSVERLDERRQQRDESRMSTDRIISALRESRDNAEGRQDTRTESLSRFEVNARFEQESRIREDVNSRKREKRKESREQTLHHMTRDNERMHDRELSRTSRFTERPSSNGRISRIREDVRSERIDVQREIRDENRASRDRTVIRRLTRDVSASRQRYDSSRTSRKDESNARIQRTRTVEDFRDERREVRELDDNTSRDRISMTRLSRERTDDQSRESRETSRSSRVDTRNEVTRNRGDVRLNERFEVRRQRDDSRSQDRVSARQTRDMFAARSVERGSREVTSRDAEMNIQSDRLSRSRNDRRIYGREISNNRDFRALESRRESRRVTEREVQPNRHNLAMERMDRTANRASQDVRIEAKLSSNIILSEDIRTDTRHEAIDTRFRNFESKVREIDSVDESSENQNALNWQMIFYTLQGAYLCGLLVQMLTEKSYQGKSRNFTWWYSSSKELLKVE